MVTCCEVAMFLAVANIIQLVFFFNYSLKLKARQIVLEKKNGKEQAQIDEIKKRLARLKSSRKKTKNA